jgi:hypothetical protein
MANKRPRSLVERDYTAFYARGTRPTPDASPAGIALLSGLHCGGMSSRGSSLLL